MVVAADSALAVVDSESQPGVALEQRGGGAFLGYMEEAYHGVLAAGQ